MSGTNNNDDDCIIVMDDDEVSLKAEEPEVITGEIDQIPSRKLINPSRKRFREDNDSQTKKQPDVQVIPSDPTTNNVSNAPQQEPQQLKVCLAKNCKHLEDECIMFTRNTLRHRELELKKSWKLLLELVFQTKFVSRTGNDFDINLCCCHFTPEEVFAINSTPQEGHKLFPTYFCDGCTPMSYRQRLKGHNPVNKSQPNLEPSQSTPLKQIQPKTKTANFNTNTQPKVVSDNLGHEKPPVPCQPHLIQGCNPGKAYSCFHKTSTLEDPPLSGGYNITNSMGKVSYIKTCIMPYCRHDEQFCQIRSHNKTHNNLKDFFENSLGSEFIEGRKNFYLCVCHYKVSDVLAMETEELVPRFNFDKKECVNIPKSLKDQPWQLIPSNFTLKHFLKFKSVAKPVFEPLKYENWKIRVEHMKLQKQVDHLKQKLSTDQFLHMTDTKGSKFAYKTYERACKTKFLMSWDAYNHLVQEEHHPFPSSSELYRFMTKFIRLHEQEADDDDDFNGPDLDVGKIKENIAEFELCSLKNDLLIQDSVTEDLGDQMDPNDLPCGQGFNAELNEVEELDEDEETIDPGDERSELMDQETQKGDNTEQLNDSIDSNSVEVKDKTSDSLEKK